MTFLKGNEATSIEGKEGTLFSEENKELLDTINEALKSMGFQVEGGSICGDDLYVDVGSIKCCTSTVPKYLIGEKIRGVLYFDGKLYVGGQHVCNNQA